MPLTSEQVDSVKRDGFLAVPRITSNEEALKIRASLERLFAERAGWKEGAYGDLAVKKDEDEEANSPQILLPVNYAPELHKTECFLNAFEMAKQILGEQASFVLDLAILKRAGSGQATPWHQDDAFRDPQFEYKEVTIWVALQDVDEKSGCLMFIPRSHGGAVLEHRQTRRDGGSISLECVGGFAPSAAVKASLPLGGCTIHLPRTLHASTPNFSAVPRIVYIMSFGLPPARSATPATFPWRDDSTTEMQLRRRRWMLHGGMFITAWRRLRRGDLNNWRKLFYFGMRATKTMVRGR
jgi:hypothetical protein